MKYCSECGNKLSDNAKFCGECGSIIERSENKIKEQSVQNAQKTSEHYNTTISDDDGVKKPRKKKRKLILSILVVLLLVFGAVMFLGDDGSDIAIQDNDTDVVAQDGDDVQVDTVVISSNTNLDTSVPESYLIENVVVGQRGLDDGRYKVDVLGLVNQDEMDETSKITEDMILWEHIEYMLMDELTEMEPISRAKLTKNKNVVVEIRGILYCLYGDTGEILWKQPLNGSGADIICGKNDLIFVSCYYGDFLKCFTTNGELLWSVKESEEFYWANHVSLKDGLVNVSFGEEDNIAKFDMNGNFIEYAEKVSSDGAENVADDTNEEINFSDIGFENALRDASGLGNMVITRGDLEKMTKLDFKNNIFSHDIKSLDDLVYFKNLRMLRIGGKADNKIQLNSDLTILKELRNLEYLSLTAMTLEGDLRDLTCVDVERLYIEGTDVTGDVRDLSQFTKLRNLGLSYSQFTGDIESLSNLTEMETLYLHASNVFGNIENLRGLVGLKKLNVRDTDIYGDIDSLKHLSLEEIHYENSNVN